MLACFTDAFSGPQEGLCVQRSWNLSHQGWEEPTYLNRHCCFLEPVCISGELGPGAGARSFSVESRGLDL